MELLTLPRNPSPGPGGPPLFPMEGAPNNPPPRPFPTRPSYYAVFAANGSLLKSEPAAEREKIEFTRPRLPLEYRNRQYRRELVLRGPENAVVIVGQDVRPQFDQMQWLGTQLLASGLAVLALGLIGGWWLAGRAIRPLEQIGTTARGIEASKLSERFNVESTDLELRELSATLNSMLERLEAGFEQQNRFTADASHELRTPLAVLLSHTELALTRQRSPGEYQATLKTIHRSGERMKGLVEDLLVLARVNSGRLDLRRERTDLRQLAEESAQLLRPLADAAGVELRVAGESVFAEIDSPRMGQALVNLIANAIKYNRPQGSVSVEVEQTADAVVLRVSDTGVGIPVESLPHLFEPFYRVDADRSRETGGSGLGLAISRRLVNAHGGEITVHSERGVGSRFEIRLPAVNGLEGKSNLAVDD
ncbi:MAG: sensor histidine kinase [Planctomycetota bacterium]|jgi:heavy metal sensor kinase